QCSLRDVPLPFVSVRNSPNVPRRTRIGPTFAFPAGAVNSTISTVCPLWPIRSRPDADSVAWKRIEKRQPPSTADWSGGPRLRTLNPAAGLPPFFPPFFPPFLPPVEVLPVKVAVTARGAVIVTTQVVPAPEHAPLQLWNFIP